MLLGSDRGVDTPELSQLLASGHCAACGERIVAAATPATGATGARGPSIAGAIPEPGRSQLVDWKGSS